LNSNLIRSFDFDKIISVKIGIANIFFFLCIFAGQAQNEVSWEISYDAAESAVLVNAAIGEGWHLYSTEKASDLGPIPTEIVFDKAEGMEIVGELQEPDPKVSFDSNFGETLYYFEESVTFSQEVELHGAQELNGTITYMVCNDEMCMPPVDYKFTIELAHEN